MDQLALRLVDVISHHDGPLGWGILGLSAGVEYLFPPFPGDTLTIFGAFLITARGWSFAGVLCAVLIGSAAGAMGAFWLGKLLEKKHIGGPRVHALVERFRRHGEAYLVLNRFLPAVRSLFFVAAGMAGMRPSRVLLWAMVSAVLWNLLLIAVGSAVGANFEALLGFFTTYSRLVWLALGALVVVLVVRAIVKRVRGKKA